MEKNDATSPHATFLGENLMQERPFVSHQIVRVHKGPTIDRLLICLH